ncbi:Crp/Fnr family transcriptional regulator [Candidatus Saccharibacteria bacterium]|nr:Crp/Fnr family transcriptional regulator [Candidatus Saccharibacteria bacterium]
MPTAPKSVETLLEERFSQHRLLTIKKGRPLLYQGEIPQMVFLIKSGVVKMYNITNTGEERIVGYEFNGGLLPVEWLFGRSPVSLYYSDTYTDCQLYRITRSELLKYIDSDLEMSSALLQRSISMYIGATIHLHALEQSKAANKLIYILQYLVMRFGKPVDSTHSKIDLRLTHQDIANLIGITRETASTEMGKLAKAGVLKIKDYHYVVNNQKALRMLGESDFESLTL